MNAVAPLPVAVPLLGAAILVAGGRWVPARWAHAFAVAVAVAVLAVSVALVVGSRQALIVHWFGGWKPSGGVALGVSFTVDQFGATGAVLAAVIVSAALLTAAGSEDLGHIGLALMMTTLAAATGFCLTGDLFNLFVFFELMSVSVFGLIAMDASHVGALRGALQMAVSNSIGAFFVLVGIALLYARTGALNLAAIGDALSRSRSDQLVVTALVLILAGFMIKAAIVPFHFWVVDAAGGAPLPIGMLLVGVVDTLGLYAVGRIYWTVFSGVAAPHVHVVRAVLLVLGSGTALIGAALSWEEKGLKRRLAYVSVCHTGIMLLGVGVLDPAGLAGFGMYAVADGAVKAGLFAAAYGATEARSPKPRIAGVLMGMGALALAGFPLFGTALAKGLIEQGASSPTRWILVVVLVVTSTVTSASVMRLAFDWWRAGSTAGDRVRTPRPWAVAGAGLLGAAAAASLVPGLTSAAVRAAARVTDRVGYSASVLRGVHSPASAGLPVHVGIEPILFGLLGSGVAVALAVAAGPAASAATVATPRSALTILKSRSIGDAVTWLTVGTALLGAGLSLAFR